MNHSALIPTYRPLPIRFTHGEGAYLFDENQNRYLDVLSGIAVTNLGHAHPKITAAITEQAQKLLHTSNAVEIPYQQTLAQKLCALTGMSQVFFSNSGAEANECAIKIARLYGHQRQINNPTIIVMESAFHGRTMATLTASGSRKVQAGFEPLVAGFVRAPYNDLEAIETIAKNSHDVVAVLVEPIQGEGGIHVPDDTYLTGLRALCDQHDWLLMLDEVQTGVGRTGQLYAYQHHNITPDVLCSAKGLGNGVPIGATLIHHRALDVLGVGQHGTTFGGNPMCTRVAATVLDCIQDDQLTANASAQGQRLMTQLSSQLAHCDHVIEVRGKGLMIGIELNTPCRSLLKEGLAQGILFNVTGADKVVRLLPPLIINDQQTDEIAQKISDLIKNFS